MGYKLKILDFGPIQEVDTELLDTNLFIGPQASGKSTIVKMVYFFLSLKKDLWMYLYEEENRNFSNFELTIRRKFEGFWGTAKVKRTFFVKFEYSCGKTIELIPLGNGYIGVDYSCEFKDELSSIFNRANEFGQVLKPSLERELPKMISGLFAQDMETEIVYIPAGRSILSTQPDFLRRQIMGKVFGDNQPMVLPLMDFIERISALQRFFDKPIDEVIEETKALSSPYAQPDVHCLDIARERMESVLKATYRYDKNGGKIIVGKTEIPPAFASSGQQESLWIVMTLFYLMLKKNNAFIIVEEPEANLFPEGQKYITELMALAANRRGNQLFVTTHSPYILTSFNNLIYACQVGQKAKEQTEKIIDRNLWMEEESVKAFFVEEGGVRSIIDEKLKLIKAEEIDKISGFINEEFNRIADVEYGV
ncbi:MAG: ATP-binding protein [Bacteroidales bacterium]|nr:ATP-binding protein [Bacteroidales bacterium]